MQSTGSGQTLDDTSSEKRAEAFQAGQEETQASLKRLGRALNFPLDPRSGLPVKAPPTVPSHAPSNQAWQYKAGPAAESAAPMPIPKGPPPSDPVLSAPEPPVDPLWLHGDSGPLSGLREVTLNEQGYVARSGFITDISQELWGNTSQTKIQTVRGQQEDDQVREDPVTGLSVPHQANVVI